MFLSSLTKICADPNPHSKQGLPPHAFEPSLVNAPSNDHEFITARLPKIENKKNELNDSTLREIKLSARWTPQKRLQQSLWAQCQKPWLHSTGPKTAEGKAKSAKNSFKTDERSVRLRDLKLYIDMAGHFACYCLAKKRVEYYNVLNPNDLYKNVRAAMKVEEILLKMRVALTKAGIENPALDARLLVRQGGGFSDADLITKSQSPLSADVVEKIEQMAIRRAVGEPLSRIVGRREFWGLSFKISPDTLDPRPDTETLVEAALKTVQFSNLNPLMGGGLKTPISNGLPNRPLKILDLGTGSGCILIALLKELPHASGVGVDMNAGALSVSCENANTHNVANRAEFRQGSWFDTLKGDEQFDLIVSNPPYIPESDIESLAVEVKNHDPMMALSGGESGLEAYKIILAGIKKHLVCGEYALFEIGIGQEHDITRLAVKSGMQVTESYPDLAGTLRVLKITHGENLK